MWCISIVWNTGYIPCMSYKRVQTSLSTYPYSRSREHYYRGCTVTRSALNQSHYGSMCKVTRPVIQSLTRWSISYFELVLPVLQRTYWALYVVLVIAYKLRQTYLDQLDKVKRHTKLRRNDAWTNGSSSAFPAQWHQFGLILRSRQWKHNLATTLIYVFIKQARKFLVRI